MGATDCSLGFVVADSGGVGAGTGSAAGTVDIDSTGSVSAVTGVGSAC